MQKTKNKYDEKAEQFYTWIHGYTGHEQLLSTKSEHEIRQHADTHSCQRLAPRQPVERRV